ncbi:hypothetical protein CLIB1444_17S00540 [[Candida] jaroonii]|uniref:Uncharacterized protein n=1 Tax=[Candida] jaroonii TaxID=467808 RepID=A0ACA9YFC8_9ASCO|nr:hypothetical protein CLIB1444_17S00540 [[Candida] jaroonii]
MQKNKNDLSLQEDELITNILPSYQMFQSTISKTLSTPGEDFSRAPPMYELTNVSSTNSLSAIQSPFSPSPTEDPTEFPFPIINQGSDQQEQIEIWENTILANIHKLQNLSKSDNKISKQLKVDITITRNVCQKGIPPDIIDTSNKEFKQGDYIHGFVTIENVSQEPLSFDMIYVVFEGTQIVLENNDGLIDTQKPKVVHKFLNMTDLFASWSFANINRLTTDNGDPRDWCEGDTDPYDNTLLSLDLDKKLLPGLKYKRFFSFRVPDKLLDDICDLHNLNGHTILPPSMGFPKYSVRPSSLLAEKSKTVNDLSFLDTCINYSVECRVIGKAHDYNLQDKKNQYVIANECIKPVRVIPLPNYYYNEEPREIMRYYKGFVSSIKDKIDLGKALQSTTSSLSDLSLTPMNSSDSKIKQLFRSSSDLKTPIVKEFDDVYQNTIPFKKKGILSTKTTSFISLCTPKKHYSIKYVPPIRFRDQPIRIPELSIPLQLIHHENSSSSLDIKSIKAELIVGTFRSSGHPLPVEFCHEFFINDDELEIMSKNEAEIFNERVVNPRKQDLKTLNKLIDKVGGENIRVDRRLYDDLKALALLSGKFSIFEINDPKLMINDKLSNVSDITWNSINNQAYQTDFKLNLDLHKCSSKSYNIPKHGDFFDYVTLVPDNQTCFSVRLYYIKVTVKLAKSDSLVVKIPFNVER